MASLGFNGNGTRRRRVKKLSIPKIRKRGSGGGKKLKTPGMEGFVVPTALEPLGGSRRVKGPGVL